MPKPPPRLRSCSLVATVALAMVGCVGSFDERGPGGQSIGIGSPDAGGAVAACDPPGATDIDGHHDPGLGCMTSSCHGAAGIGPVFTLGGTLYSDVAGTTAVAGATVHVIDSGGNDLAIVTASNGNFWATAAIAGFPGTTRASLCPDAVPMITPLAASGVDCNAAGCHASGFRIHVP